MRRRATTEGRVWGPDDTYVVVSELQVDLPKATRVEVHVRALDEPRDCSCNSYAHPREDCPLKNASYVTQLEWLVRAVLSNRQVRPGWTEMARRVLGLEDDYKRCGVCGEARKGGCRCKFSENIKTDIIL